MNSVGRTGRTCSFCESIQLCLDNYNEREVYIESEQVQIEKNILTEVPPHFLPVILSVSEENRTCPICVEGITNNAYLTRCFHLYHLDCIQAYLDTGNNRCPICRIKISGLK